MTAATTPRVRYGVRVCPSAGGEHPRPRSSSLRNPFLSLGPLSGPGHDLLEFRDISRQRRCEAPVWFPQDFFLIEFLKWFFSTRFELLSKKLPLSFSKHLGEDGYVFGDISRHLATGIAPYQPGK